MPGLKGLFLAAAADRARVPVVLLSGFLGAGKTTLVNALIADPRLARTAVAVNEFGAIPLDADLIDHGADKTLVMANGCLCCNLAGDLEEAMLRVFSRRATGDLPAFDRLIIEPSGLADPAPIAQTILRNPLMAGMFRLDGILTVVDALHIEAQIARHPEARKQVALADTILLGKMDIADEATRAGLVRRLRAINPDAPIHVASHGRIDAATLLPADFLAAPATDLPETPPRLMLAAEEAAPPPSAHDLSGVVAVALTAPASLDWRAFEAWLRGIRLSHGEALLRVKGLIDVAGVAGPIVLHGIHHVLHPPVEAETWPDARRATRLVLIVEAPVADGIRRSWTDALPQLIA